mmetsp:Transcript_9960/g.28752  ORF Transcript_9960/g.28752 Transcript_9960/m.28752 type:complete len:85 (+) Transcript_9960:259-513(+)
MEPTGMQTDMRLRVVCVVCDTVSGEKTASWRPHHPHMLQLCPVAGSDQMTSTRNCGVADATMRAASCAKASSAAPSQVDKMCYS